MLYLLRCNSIFSDSRTIKYVDFLKRKDVPFKVLGWNRTGEKLPESDNFTFYNRKAGYQEGGLRAIKGRMFWMSKCIKYLYSNSKSVTTIHACDLDTAFPAAIYKLFSIGKKKLIFDIFDWYSDNITNQPWIVRLAFKFMEWLTVKVSDEIIICEPEREEQIPYKLKKKPLVLPNIPSFADSSFLVQDGEYKFDNDLLTLTYVGGFTNDRCLDELLSLVEKTKINLLVAGYGLDDIVEKCQKLNDTHDNIKYFGKQPYKEALKIMYNADIVFAMYQKVSRNNVFAAPNKYYEAMFLGKPIFSTKGTILESKIIRNGIGYVSEESMEEILKELELISKEDCKMKGEKASRLWQEKYSTYIEDFLNNNYIGLLYS